MTMNNDNLLGRGLEEAGVQGDGRWVELRLVHGF